MLYIIVRIYSYCGVRVSSYSHKRHVDIANHAPMAHALLRGGFKYYHHVNTVLQKAMPQHKQIVNLQLCRNTLQ